MLYLVLLILTIIILLIKYQQKAPAIFGGGMLVTVLMGWVSPETMLKNAANPGLATLVLLILISFALEKTSLLRKVSSYLFSPSMAGSIWRTMGFSALASSVLNNTAVVAALLNSVRSNKHVAPSKLLIPLSYAAIMGGTLTLIGTSTNLIVNSMFTDTGNSGFAFFDFTLVGLGVTFSGLIVLFVMSYWLPDSREKEVPTSAYFVEARIASDSQLIGKTVQEAGLRHLDELFLAEIIRKREIIRPVARYDVLQAGDKLIFSGNVTKVMALKQFPGLTLFAEDNGLTTHKLTEVIIKEDSVLVGKTLKGTGFRARFDAAVVAIRRDGGRVTGKLGEVFLQPGDFLLLATGPDFSSRHNISKNFYVLSGVNPDSMLSGWRERVTLWGFVAMIAGTVITGSPLFIGALLLLALLLFTGSLNSNEIKRRFPVEIWLIVTSALCIASSMDATGLSDEIGDFAREALSGHAPFVTFAGVFLLTYLLTELITNNAAAALMFPIAYSLALGLGIDPFPMVMGVAFAASASFLTPYGYQTNLMVFNASTYRLKHFLQTGTPVAVAYIASCLVLIPTVFPL